MTKEDQLKQDRERLKTWRDGIAEGSRECDDSDSGVCSSHYFDCTDCDRKHVYHLNGMFEKCKHDNRVYGECNCGAVKSNKRELQGNIKVIETLLAAQERVTREEERQKILDTLQRYTRVTRSMNDTIYNDALEDIKLILNQDNE